MGNLLSMGAYNAVGGLINRYKRKRTSSKKKGVLKKRKMASKASTRKGTVKKTTTNKVRAIHAKMSDQRVTKMKFEDDGVPSVLEASDTDRGYFAVQDTGGYRTVCLAVAGSFLRDTLGKNGIKFPSWNTHSEENSANNYWDTVVQRCFGIQFYFSRTESFHQSVGTDFGVSITEAGGNWNVTNVHLEKTKLFMPENNSVIPAADYKMKTLYKLTDDLADIFYFWALRGFYPSAYEVCTQIRSNFSASDGVVVKFRESNLASASLSLLIDTQYQITNWSPASQSASASADGYDTRRFDRTPLQFTKYKMRNLGIKVRDSVHLAADDLNFSVEQLARVNQAEGYSSTAVLHNGTDWFNPFERPPQGPVVFKNLGSRTRYGLQPGKSVTEKFTFSYSGAFADLFKRVIQQEVAVKVTYGATGTQNINESAVRKVAGPMVPGGSLYLFAYERVKLMHGETAAPVAHKDRRFISTYCSMQPFKAAPLPVYNRTTDWNT